MPKKLFMMGNPEVFGGDAKLPTNVLFYVESPAFFAETIKRELKPGSYRMADFGGAGGGLCANILKLLPEYSFEVDVFDIDTKALATNTVAKKIYENDLIHTTAQGKSYDLTIMRYVLQWNTIEDQRNIIAEIVRVTKGIAIIQHCGPDDAHKDRWRLASEKMINGTDIERMHRQGYFYSSPNEIEHIYNELGIKTRCIQSRRIEPYADIFVERYLLNKEEKSKVYEAVMSTNYIIQTSWLLDFRDKLD